MNTVRSEVKRQPKHRFDPGVHEKTEEHVAPEEEPVQLN